MKLALVAALSGASLLASVSNANAGVFSDDLGRCLVASVSTADKMVLSKWIFSIMGNHPSVASIKTTDAAADAVLNQDAMNLYERLLTRDCRKEAVAALKYEGENAMEASFQILGGTATRELMSHPAVEEKLIEFGNLVDIPKWAAIYKEAGITVEDDE